ncbi:TetR/AcrR family transcriptional regulator [Streptomyces sp. NA04227]|uniref:TetR/AcrR family transcriptional regulator n=1 Tax=Streptomyces sp. NA04227 TaxID=2742136 RepID=UPI0015929142|nr:TetR/AcrR family transcriptional regulator [Streptomyces sp. NA04227]QKW07931.1 TetR/AcrR family transcriptional regulator [Streptomyces sp. NA04227]
MVKAAEGTRRPARSSVWLERSAARGATDRRSDQPSGLDRARITAATVRLLDAEGLAKFSMRRLAAELHVTAMSVYWYVDTKDDLLELALDAVYGEMTLPVGELGTEDWRDQLRALAAEYRSLHVRHPWVSPLTGNYLNIGPRAREFSHAVQRVVRGTGLGPQGQMGAISAVFQFVYGFGTIEGQFIRRCANAGVSQDDYLCEALRGVNTDPELADSLKQATGLIEAGGAESVEEMRERDFRWALDLLISGIEVAVGAESIPPPRS